MTIGLIRALGRFGFPDNYLITRLFPQEAPPPSPASQLVTTKQSFSNFRYLLIYFIILNIHVLSFFVTTRFFSPFCIVKFLSFNMNIVRFIIFVAFAIYIPTNGLRKPNEAFFIEIYQHPN